tara:strand:+ start:73 stop:249 length:177 start_codon:yes stop_codon:yes gene_type:complete
MSDYQTPHKDGEVEKSLDEEDDLNDRENVAPTSRLFLIKTKTSLLFCHLAFLNKTGLF